VLHPLATANGSVASGDLGSFLSATLVLIFRLDTLKSLVCSSLNEARSSAGFLIPAYPIMTD
jgi:hypothetical protein